MPHIRRIRIVNISYNNGKRLIPDELFDLTNEDGREGLNTLISLINGGGKSVLVQMMMQPVLPRAHASSRRIEEYFTHSGDHGYILLEWMLDRSDTRLLTGIAIAAAETNDDSRGRSIKYYTFCTTYTQDSAKYSILNLELSRRENHRFVPAEFEFVRKLASRSSGELLYYSDRESADWKAHLEEYGILQEQWRTLTERLNSSENGMTGYFEKFKTADQLIDGLLIPAIEAHLAQMDTAGENTLSAMMLGYLEQYRTQEKRVAEREICRRFIDAMTERQKAVHALWNTDDAHRQAVGRLFDFQAALKSEISALRARIEELLQKQADAEEQLHRIGWEEASERYWKAKEAAEQAAEAYRLAQEAAAQCTESITQKKQAQRRMQAAKYAARAEQAKNDAAAISAQIQEKEQNSEAKQLTVLGAGIRRILETELPALHDTVTQQQQEVTAADADLQQAQKQQNQAELAAQKAQTEYDKAECALSLYQQDTDRLVQDLQLEIQRNFTGCYSADELQKIINVKTAEQHKLEETKSQLDAALQAISERSDQIPDERMQYSMDLDKTTQYLDSLQTERTQYLEQEEQLRQIFALHSLDFALRFSSAAADYLKGKLREAKSDLRQEERHLEQKTEELAAANAGSLHIPQTVLNWLDQTDLQYQTCESYLLHCELTAEQIDSVLRHCPAAAYGILVTDAEKQLLDAAARPDWLPAALPVFTYANMTAIMQQTYPAENLLGYYAQGYFEDHDGFIGILETEKDEISHGIDRIQERIRRLTSELQTVSDFQYDDTWLPRTEQEIREQTEIITAIRKQLAALEQEKTDLSKQQKTVRAQIADADCEIRAMTTFVEHLQDLQKRLPYEEELYSKYETAQQAAVNCRKELESARQAAESCRIAKEQAESALKQNENLLTEMQQAQTAVQNYTSETVIEGDWQGLYQQFQTLCETQDDSIRVLREKLHHIQESMQNAQEELRKTGCQPEEYAGMVYSEQAETAFADALERLETQQNELQLQQAVIACAESNGKAQYALEQAMQQMTAFGEPLAASQITGNYAGRKAAAETQRKELEQQIKQTEGCVQAFDKLSGRTEEVLRNIQKPEAVKQLALEADAKQQWQRLCDAEYKLRTQLVSQHRDLLEDLQKLLSEFEYTAQAEAIRVMTGLMQQDSIQGDRYYTLNDLITESVKSTELRTSQIDAELNDFDNTKQDLVRQCVLQGQQIFQGLQTIMKNSRFQAYEDIRKEMLKIDLPKEIDEKLAAEEIAADIERAAQEIIGKMEREKLTAAELKQRAADAVSSRHLLRLYIRKETIEIWGYKVDSNFKHGEYRRWKDIPRTNSGAERFLVYFAVIVLLMDYSGSEAGIRSSEHTNVLILDNPFAVITSAHFLEPMFSMAKQFRIQLICLSDITKCDITNCFDLHIKAAVRQNTLSEIGILSHEGNEQIEHGFYRATQFTLM